MGGYYRGYSGDTRSSDYGSCSAFDVEKNA